MMRLSRCSALVVLSLAAFCAPQDVFAAKGQGGPSIIAAPVSTVEVVDLPGGDNAAVSPTPSLFEELDQALENGRQQVLQRQEKLLKAVEAAETRTIVAEIAAETAAPDLLADIPALLPAPVVLPREKIASISATRFDEMGEVSSPEVIEKRRVQDAQRRERAQKMFDVWQQSQVQAQSVPVAKNAKIDAVPDLLPVPVDMMTPVPAAPLVVDKEVLKKSVKVSKRAEPPLGETAASIKKTVAQDEPAEKPVVKSNTAPVIEVLATGPAVEPSKPVPVIQPPAQTVVAEAPVSTSRLAALSPAAGAVAPAPQKIATPSFLDSVMSLHQPQAKNGVTAPVYGKTVTLANLLEGAGISASGLAIVEGTQAALKWSAGNVSGMYEQLAASGSALEQADRYLDRYRQDCGKDLAVRLSRPEQGTAGELMVADVTCAVKGNEYISTFLFLRDAGGMAVMIHAAQPADQTAAFDLRNRMAAQLKSAARFAAAFAPAQLETVIVR